MLERLSQLVDRLNTYPWWQILLELAVIWVIVWLVVRLVQGTRAASALKSAFLLIVVATLIIRILGQHEAFARLSFLFSSLVGVAAIALIVIFQPELRRGLMRLGEAPIFGSRIEVATETVDAVSEAAAYLAKARFGGLIVIERTTPLKGLAEGGTALNADVSARLLQTIFFPGSALHDLAVLIKDDRIRAAGVQLPLADADVTPDPNLGSRHRAALGISLESDALVVVVSEETGTISLVEAGDMTRGLNEAELRGLLLLKLNKGLVTAVQETPEAVVEERRPEADADQGAEMAPLSDRDALPADADQRDDDSRHRANGGGGSLGSGEARA